MTLSEELQTNSAYHKFLLNRINELEHTPSAHEAQTKYLTGLGNELKGVEQKAEKLAKKTKEERKEHEEIRDSVGRKFMAKVAGRKDKFELKQAKEEKEYIEAFEREVNERNHAETLRKLIGDAQKVISELEPKVAEYTQRDTELHALYARVFDGPTQEYPQDDFLESNLAKAKQEYEQAQHKFLGEEQAAELLHQARESMNLCREEINTALSYSSYDMWGGDTFADAMERSSLAKAQQLGSASQMLVLKASHVSPNVDSRVLDGLYIAQGNILMDVVFDNIFTDLSFHQKIQESLDSAAQSIHLLTVQQSGAAERVATLFSIAESVKANLAKRREELDTFRQSVFEGATGHAGGNLNANLTGGQVDLGRSPTYKPPEGPPPYMGS